MVRKHGWQLPAHTFQVVAVTVYCLLVIAFYAFFAPFLGGRIWEYALVATYSPVALIVFVLYIRCTAINPADPGIMFKFDSKAIKGPNPKELPRIFDDHSRGDHSSPSVASMNSIAAASSSKKGSLEAARINAQLTKSNKRSSCNVGGIFCALFVHEDCRKQDEPAEQDGTGEDALFCTLCNAEVRKFSKHCRSCDKCVDGFDHHCRWLNNCVGYKNYVTFISLMATSSIWLFFEAGVGIAVLVRCFVNKKTMESEIVDRLGNGFSRAPFATVVAICTAVSMLACVPLGELFFFHMILIRKGITTYEYVVAMRAMSEAPAGASVDEELPSILYSPTGSGTTGYSGGSSIGLQYKGAWCTPPRVFVDYKEEVAPHLEPGMVPSTIDPDAVGIAGRDMKATKKPVRISAWKLAKLDSNEAVKAAAKARASSSVLRPVDNQRLPDVELSSSGNMSVRSSMSTDTGGANKDLTNELRLSPYRNSFAPSHGSRDDYETGTQSVSSFSSPNHVHESVTLSPLPPAHGLNQSSTAVSGLGVLPNSTLSKPISAGFDKSIAQITSGFDEKMMQKGTADPLLLPAPATSAALLRDVKRTSVVWDQEAGRYVSIPVSALEARSRPSFPVALSNRQAGSTTLNTWPADSLQDPSQLPAKNAVQQSENLTYTGESIFYGGPLFSGNLADNLRNDRASGSEDARHRATLALPRESRFKRDAASNQLPVFIPTNHEQNPSSASRPK